MARVVVVGGGFAGLAVAARLARGRHDVTVLDRAAELGGSMRAYDLGDVEVGPPPASFTMPAVLRDLFRKTGKPIEDVLELVPVDPARRYVFADGSRLDLPSGNRAATIAALDAGLGRGVGAEWESLLVRGREMWDVLRPNVVDVPITSRRHLRRALGSRRGRTAVPPRRTLEQLAGATLSDIRARQLLGTYAVALGADPAKAPAAFAVLPYLEHAFGAWAIDGGMPALVTALAERATLRGARLRCRAEVAEIVVADGRTAGVQLTDGQRVPADIVVVAIDVRSAARLLAGSRSPWPGSRRRGPATSRFTAVITSDDLTPAPGGPAETVFVGTAPVVTVTHRAAGTRSVWTVSAPALAHDGRRHDWRTADVPAAYLETVLATLAGRGLDLRRHRVATVQTPADLEQATGAPGGALLGPPPHGLSGAFARAANASTAVPGLYAVGASAHPGPGLPFTGLSAALVSELIGPAPRAGRPAGD